MSAIGKLIITGVSGESLTKDEAVFFEQIQPSGVILFSRNYSSPAQLKELVRSIQLLAKDKPFLVSVDQEGGRVQRFKEGFTIIPPMLELAKEESPKKIFEIHQLIAEELVRCGVNVNFSPVCDALTNPKNQVIGDRAFSTDPEEVSKFVTAAIRGMLTKNLICCAKHFPGHGRSRKDSHLGKVILKITQEELEEELIPFRKAIRSKVPMLMPSHMIVDIIDPNLPCSLSPKAISYIRKELGFDRVIISDDFSMDAIKAEFGIGEASVMAIKAGCDLLCYRDLELAQEGLESLENAYGQGVLDFEKVQKSFERIDQMKKHFLSEYQIPVI